MQVAPGLKKRSPFAFASNDDDDSLAGAGILDDQEQEEIIQKLKVENDISDKQIWLSLRIVMGCFALLHVLYLFRRVNPLSRFLSNAQPPRIPFDIPFGLLHTATLLGLAALAQFDDRTLVVGIPAPSYARIYTVTAIAPTYCSLAGQDLTNTAWWGFALVAVALHHVVRSLILRGRKNISQLEALKYDARGA